MVLPTEAYDNAMIMDKNGIIMPKIKPYGKYLDGSSGRQSRTTA